jgi:hypothetical protein
VIVSMRCRRDPPQPVQAPDDKGVPWSEMGECLFQPCAL